MASEHDEKQAAPDLHEAIRQVLMQEWDPIGIKDTPECHDEYNAYIGGIYRLLARGATEQQIVEHLDRIESQQMLLPREDKAGLTPVARKLRGLGLARREAG